MWVDMLFECWFIVIFQEPNVKLETILNVNSGYNPPCFMVKGKEFEWFYFIISLVMHCKWLRCS